MTNLLVDIFHDILDGKVSPNKEVVKLKIILQPLSWLHVRLLKREVSLKRPTSQAASDNWRDRKTVLTVDQKDGTRGDCIQRSRRANKWSNGKLQLQRIDPLMKPRCFAKTVNLIAQ